MQIDEIEMYFETFGYPNEDVEIFQGRYVLCESAELFVTSNIICLKSHTGNKTFMPYFLDLLQYYNICKHQLNYTL